jgi:hypothetical protein
MRIKVFAGVFLLFCSGIPAQQPQSVTESNPKLSLSVSSLSFFRNNEYFNPITEGYTLTGSHLRPLLVWKPFSSVEIKGGLFLSLWSGFDRGIVARPHFSVGLQLNNSTNLIVGSLSGSDHHNMFDPHFDSEKLYTAFQEEGLQLVHRSGSVFSDTWINWEEFIFHGDNRREEFTFGGSFRYFTGSGSSVVRFELPVQLLAKHRGGQISNYTAPVETHLNFAAGPRIVFGNHTDGAGGTGFDATVFLYSVNTTLPGIPFESGKALWIRGDHTFGKVTATAGVWMSDNFYSPNGNMMFSSVSDYQAGVHLPQRTLLTGSVNYINEWEAGFLSLLLGFDWYYDLAEKNFDHTMTLHIRIPEKKYGISKR